MTVEQLRTITSIQIGVSLVDIVLTCTKHSGLTNILRNGQALHEYNIKKNTMVHVGWVCKSKVAKLRNTA
jgi:hypothetical protein